MSAKILKLGIWKAKILKSAKKLRSDKILDLGF